MNPFDNVNDGEITNAHGEVNFFKIADGTVDLTDFTPFKKDKDVFVVGHSESGHNHVLEAEGVDVMECVSDGMQILYAIVKNPATLKQSAGAPHKEQTVAPGKYLITNNIEVNPWTKQAQRVAD